MSTTTKCDICQKVIKRGEGLNMMWDHRISWHDICLTCWQDKTKWPLIHQVKKTAY